MTQAARPDLILALDTSTRASLVMLGGASSLSVSRREVRHRHGSHLLEQIDEALVEAGATLDDVTALAVGTGPGSFTGLRVGLATAKTIAYARTLPLVGVMSSDALRRAAIDTGAPDDAAVVLPAGARDHYLAIPGDDPVLVAPGGLPEALGDRTAIAIDVDEAVFGSDAARWGELALAGLPQALLSIARDRLSVGDIDAAVDLTPAYIALPRGVARAAEELGWSPDLR